MQLELKHLHGEKDSKETTRMKDLDKETKDRLKQRIVELENQLGEYILHLYVVVKLQWISRRRYCGVGLSVHASVRA